jgi:Glycine zipper
MKKKFLIALLGVLVGAVALAQQGPPQQLNGVSAANQMSLSSSLGLHAFPAKDQTPQQRQTDESACYGWAKQDSGFDPIAAGSNAVASGYSAPPAGLGIRGAAAGAAGGAAIGAIAGNAGKGAAIGATAGGIRGRMVQRRAQAEAQQQAQAKSQTQKTGLENFKRAFSACMEAKGYSVK